MARALKRIKVKPGSDLDHLLDEATEEPLLLEKSGVLYRLSVEKEDIWADYDPKKVRRAITKTAGAWADVDAGELIEAVYRAREEGSRPPGRP